MIREIYHLLPYIIFGASLGSSLVHFVRKQFPRNIEPPPLPKGPDPLILTYRGMAGAYTALRRETTRQESLILITTAVAVSASIILKIIGDRK